MQCKVLVARNSDILLSLNYEQELTKLTTVILKAMECHGLRISCLVH